MAIGKNLLLHRTFRQERYWLGLFVPSVGYVTKLYKLLRLYGPESIVRHRTHKAGFST
jgi:hypothetical protein